MRITNALLFALLATQSTWAVIDDSNIVWTDLNGESKTGRWYEILPGQESAPLVGAFTNGTITTGNKQTLWGSENNSPRTLHVGEGATHYLTELWSGSGGTPVEICIHNGGRFELVGASSCIGTKGYLRVRVHEGGTLVYGSTKVPNLAEIKQQDNWFDIFGRAEFPYGIRMASDVSQPFVFYQRAGSSVVFGGDVDYNKSQNNYFSYIIEGGSLQIIDQCAFKIPAGKGEIAAGTEATIDVADGVDFDFSPFTVWGDGAKLTKTGGGGYSKLDKCLSHVFILLTVRLFCLPWNRNMIFQRLRLKKVGLSYSGRNTESTI